MSVPRWQPSHVISARLNSLAGPALTTRRCVENLGGTHLYVDLIHPRLRFNPNMDLYPESFKVLGVLMGPNSARSKGRPANRFDPLLEPLRISLQGSPGSSLRWLLTTYPIYPALSWIRPAGEEIRRRASPEITSGAGPFMVRY